VKTSKLGVSFRAVSTWENNLACPDISLLPKMADLFNVSIDVLFDHETKNIHESSADLPWEGDDTYNIVVYRGHTLLESKRLPH